MMKRDTLLKGHDHSLRFASGSFLAARPFPSAAQYSGRLAGGCAAAGAADGAGTGAPRALLPPPPNVGYYCKSLGFLTDCSGALPWLSSPTI